MIQGKSLVARVKEIFMDHFGEWLSISDIAGAMRDAKRRQVSNAIAGMFYDGLLERKTMENRSHYRVNDKGAFGKKLRKERVKSLGVTDFITLNAGKWMTLKDIIKNTEASSGACREIMIAAVRFNCVEMGRKRGFTNYYRYTEEKNGKNMQALIDYIKNTGVYGIRDISTMVKFPRPIKIDECDDIEDFDELLVRKPTLQKPFSDGLFPAIDSAFNDMIRRASAC